MLTIVILPRLLGRKRDGESQPVVQCPAMIKFDIPLGQEIVHSLEM